MRDSTPRRRSDRGMSLIEALIAMTMMALVIAGILQMFSLSLLMSFGAASRTELTVKCEQVVENLRIAQMYAKTPYSDPTLANATGIYSAGTPVAAGTVVTLPYSQAELTASPYWGPTQANVVEGPDLPYRLSFVVSSDVNAPPNAVLVTVTATTVGNTTVATTQNQGPSQKRFYLGMSKVKRVDYVAYLIH